MKKNSCFTQKALGLGSFSFHSNFRNKIAIDTFCSLNICLESSQIVPAWRFHVCYVWLSVCLIFFFRTQIIYVSWPHLWSLTKSVPCPTGQVKVTCILLVQGQGQKGKKPFQTYFAYEHKCQGRFSSLVHHRLQTCRNSNSFSVLINRHNDIFFFQERNIKLKLCRNPCADYSYKTSTQFAYQQ